MRLILRTICLVLLATCGVAMAAEPLPTIEDHTREFTARPGFMDLWIDSAEGRVFAAWPAPSGDGKVGSCLFVEALTGGLGSNPVGLDRGEVGETIVLDVRRVGRRLVFEQPNLAYRAVSDDVAEQRAVRQSFATSILWTAPIVAEDPLDGRSLIDLTPFLMLDHHGVVRRLDQAGEGTFRLSADHSVLDPHDVLVFPDNVEIDVTLTFRGDKPGREVRSVTPAPTHVSLRQHLSFVRLPDDGYRPRAFDVRGGLFSVDYQDYAVPIEDALIRRWVVRHRLQHETPGDPTSPVVKPIVYHVDPGAPEPIRQALVDGAAWWADAFAAAGFPDAFRVEVLPDGASLMDVRYNVIEWVHRATRGWSIGGGIVDPRTGERVKGHIRLGSLRVRQDRRIFEALLGVPDPDAAGDVASDTAGEADAASDAAAETAATDDDDGEGEGEDAAPPPPAPITPTRLALARIRQLSAHEVGHALGVMHNFAASTNDRASVMDYPAPLVRVAADGSLDASEAYDVGIGEWDRYAIRFGYTEFDPEDDEAAGLEAILQERIDAGYRFLTDADARPRGAAHPLANLWDNGADPIATLREVLEVRRIALERFGDDRVATGRPLAELEEALVLVYFHHRYQLTAAAKSLGGVDYRYGLRGDGQPGPQPVSPDRQRAALELLLNALQPAALDIPDAVLDRMVPRPSGVGRNRELFRGRAAPLFDPLAAARTAADLVLDEILVSERAARLTDAGRRRPTALTFDAVLAELVRRVFDPPIGEPRRWTVLRNTVRTRTVDRLIAFAVDPTVDDDARLRTEAVLRRLGERLAEGASPIERGLAARIRRFLDRTHDLRDLGPVDPAPPGSPIGAPALPLDEGLAGCSHG